MKTEVLNKEKNTVSFKVQVPQENVAKAIDQAYLIVRKDMSLPGFRKGRVPRNIMEKRFGVEVFYEEAANILLRETYPLALDDLKLEPVDQPEVEVEQIGQEQDFIYTAKVIVKPEVELGEYKNLGIARENVQVTDEDVEAELISLQSRRGQMVALAPDEPAQLEDQVIINFVGRMDGEEFEGGKGTNHPLTLGSGAFIPGFEEQLVGVQSGATVNVALTMPEEYHAEHLAGKSVEFEVVVQEIKRKELPELDDEFAKDVSEFQSLDELKQNIRESLDANGNEQADQKQRQSIIEAVSANATVDIPDPMIENEIEAMIRSTESRFAQQGFKFEDFLQYSGKDLEQYKQELRPNAENTVKIELVLDALAKLELIVVSEEELDAEIAKLAESYERKPQELRQILETSGQIAGIEQVLLHKNVVNFLVQVNSKEE